MQLRLHLSFKPIAMKPYWVKTRWFIKKLFRGYVWDIPNNGNKIYLTFDDGPTPEVTDWVLGILRQYDVKATFFCIGNNIEKHPEIFKRVIADGHAIANHTFNHVNGWRTGNTDYFTNIEATQEIISQYIQKPAKLFRPPYGKIKRSQAAKVRSLNYKIIMWDVLSADFDRTITPQKCLNNVIQNTSAGSVIIFHDSIKAFPNLEYTLPKAIEYLKGKGFVFETIT